MIPTKSPNTSTVPLCRARVTAEQNPHSGTNPGARAGLLSTCAAEQGLERYALGAAGDCVPLGPSLRCPAQHRLAAQAVAVCTTMTPLISTTRSVSTHRARCRVPTESSVEAITHLLAHLQTCAGRDPADSGRRPSVSSSPPGNRGRVPHDASATPQPSAQRPAHRWLAARDRPPCPRAVDRRRYDSPCSGGGRGKLSALATGMSPLFPAASAVRADVPTPVRGQ